MELTQAELEKLRLIRASETKKEEDARQKELFRRSFWDAMSGNFQGFVSFFLIGALHGVIIGAAVGLLVSFLPTAIVGTTIAGLGAPMLMGLGAIGFGFFGGDMGSGIGVRLGSAAAAASSVMAQKETREKQTVMEAAMQQEFSRLSPEQAMMLKQRIAQMPVPPAEPEKIFYWKNGALWGVLSAGFGALLAASALVAGRVEGTTLGSVFSQTLAEKAGSGAITNVLGAGALGITGWQAVTLAALALGVTGFTFGTSRKLYKRIFNSTEHLVQGTVKDAFTALIGKDEPTKENDMQKKSILGGVVRFAILGGVLAAAITFGAAAIPAGGALYGIAHAIGLYASFSTVGIVAGIFGALGGVKTAAQNAAAARTEAAYTNAPSITVRGPSPELQVVTPAPAQDMGQSQSAALSFAAREETRRQMAEAAPRQPS